MSRPKPSSRSHVGGTTEFAEPRLKEIRELIAAKGMCDCRESGENDCANNCSVRSFVATIGAEMFEVRAIASMANPKERVANIERVVKHLRAILKALDSAEPVLKDKVIQEIEGPNEEALLFDSSTLEYIQRNVSAPIQLASDSGLFLGLVKNLINIAEIKRAQLLIGKRAKPRKPESVPVLRLIENWLSCFGKKPSSYPDGAFAEVLRNLYGENVPADEAIQSQIWEAMQKLKSLD